MRRSAAGGSREQHLRARCDVQEKALLFRLISILTLILWGSSTSAQVTFGFVDPSPDCPPVICGTAQSIYIDGEISNDDAQRLEAEILARGIPIYSTVYFNSPGGSLFGGMELGRVIRKYGFNTSVGKLSASGNSNDDGAFCYSACTLAFLGGQFRYFSDNASYGVHRFYSDQPAEEAEAMAQVASAAIITYLAEMGVKADLFVEMTKVGSDTIKTLPLREMLRLGVANNGVGETEWTLNASDASSGASILYLKGERRTSFGINKALFYCSPQRNGMMMHVIFDPQGRTDEAQMMRAISIEIDSETYPFGDYLIELPTIVNGWVNATFRLPETFWAAIKRGDSLGVMFQFSYEAPVFLGFSGMPLQGAINLMAGIENLCVAAGSRAPIGKYRRYENTDFLGADLTQSGVRDISLAQCEEICDNDRQCKAYSYVQRARWCFPKYGVQRQLQKPGIISGHK
jgi:hypothetical protein